MDENLNELIELIKKDLTYKELHDLLSHYHKNDIANALEFLDKDSRQKLYKCFDEQELSDIFSYVDDASNYIEDFEPSKAADLIELMDSDDAVEVLEDLEEDDRKEILDLMDQEAVSDIKLLSNYSLDQIGSHMTNNYIEIKKDFTIKKAMKTVVEEAEANDNFTILYVVDNSDILYGTIELKDLIKARANDNLESIIKKSYPTILDTSFVTDALITFKEYELDSIPVVNRDNHLLGVITSNDLIEVVDDELSDDYAKLAGLPEEEELKESTFTSVKKRIPWLCALLLLGVIISFVMKGFESAIVAVPVIVFFQSMILDMGGNVGTQSLAVTIRAITDDNISKKEVRRLIFKEIRIAFFNSLIVAAIAFIIVTLYLGLTKSIVDSNTGFSILDVLKTAGVVSISLIASMVISGFVGTIVPIILQKCHVDPAVASGPFITSINDITAIIIYYGIAMLAFAYLL